MSKELVDFNPKLLTKEEWLSEMNEILLRLGICLCDEQGYYKSPYDVLGELSEKWSILKEKT